MEMQVRRLSDDQLLARWCCCTTVDEHDPEYQAVYTELSKRSLIVELH